MTYNAEKRRQHYIKNKKQVLEYQNQYYTDHKEERQEYSKQYHLDNVEEKKEYKLEVRYSITQEQYNKMFADQNGCCAICGKHQSNYIKALHVDHDHYTGATRELLCVVCNVYLGRIENPESKIKAKNPKLIARAMKYINKHKGTIK